MTRLALEDIKVLDLGTMVTAPFAAMMLAQLGADVTKVEHPQGGDPFRKTTGGSYSPNFIAYNQNKKSIALDLATQSGRAQLLKMVAESDVLIENYRPGVLNKLGLKPEMLLEANPRLIHCSITGFGDDGPYSQRPAYDTVGIALSGLLHLYLDRENPQVLGPTVSDNVTGMFACSGILAALHARANTGQPQRVEVNMLECAIALIPDAFAYLTRGLGAHDPLSRAASSQCFAWTCSDGKAISVHLSVQEKFWNALVAAMNIGGTVGADERFQTRKLRIANYTALTTLLSEVVRSRPMAHWAETFAAADIPFAPVHTIPEVLTDPQVRHLGTFETVRHPIEGEVTGIRSPIRINGERSSVQAPPTFRQNEQAAPLPSDAVRISKED